MFFRHQFDELLACDGTPAVSIYLPTHPAGREVRQDAIRLRNLLSAAGQRLAAEPRGADRKGLLEPARRLIDDEEFWRYQEEGLGIFLAPGFARIHKLPIAVPERLAFGRHFSIRPLLPLLDDDASFWLLAITGRRTWLFRGSRWTLREAPGLDLPEGIAEVRNESVYQEAHNAAPTGRPQRGPAGLAKAQVFGDAPEEVRKALLLELLHRIAGAVEPVVRRQPAPVVLAAAPEIQGNFREIARWKALLSEGIGDNPDALPPAELRRKAWVLLGPRRDRQRAEALQRLHSLLGTGDAKATTKPEAIVEAARHGRVERLFLGGAEPLWGRIDEQTDRIEAHGEAAEGDADLLDYAALMTLRQGGGVSLLDREELPPAGPAAAILRY